jgi:hypothetical protein
LELLRGTRVNPAVTQVLDYRPPLADRPLTRLTTWFATPMSPRWRTIVVVSSCLVLWGAAWLPGRRSLNGRDGFD